MSFEPMTIKVRHGGDPLLAALNITPKPGSLDFGEKSSVNFHTGLILLIFSSILLIVDCYCIASVHWEQKAE